MDIRFASSDDTALLQPVIELYRQGGWWDENDGNDKMAAMISGSFCFAVAFENQAPVAMARAISDGVSDAYIQDVLVLPRFRRRGIAAALVNAILKRLKAAGINWIGLVSTGNSGPLYKKCGFEPMENAAPMLHKQ